MLSLNLEVHNGVGTVRLVGELDHNTTDELRQLAFGALDDGATSLVMDCEELSFVDSSGLNVFIELHRAATSGTITIRNPSPFVIRLIDTTKLDQVLIIES